MRHPPRRRTMPYPALMRWLALCLPVGLYHLWQRQVRVHWIGKIFVTMAATAFTICLAAGVLSLFTLPSPVMAQTQNVLVQRDIYELVVDMEGEAYHLVGCVHARQSATMPITLVQAARRSIPADERCNPPRYAAK